METKHKVLHFLLVSALWIAAVMAVTGGMHRQTKGIEESGFDASPDFVRETVDDANTLISMNLQ